MTKPLRHIELTLTSLLRATTPRTHVSRTRALSNTTTISSRSINPAEVAHFDALASTWWDPHGPSRLLHLMNPLRHDFISLCHASHNATTPVSPRRYLDVGCGGGIFAESAARLSSVHSVTAIDPSSHVLAVARAHARRDPVLATKLEYRNTSIEALALPRTVADQYDILTLFEVIEHVELPAPFLARCAQFVKPGGWLVGSTMARSWVSWLTTIAIAEHALNIVPPGTHDWSKYINPQELTDWFLSRNGWNNPVISGVVYIPWIGWKMIDGSEKVGNYFFGIQRDL